MGHFGIEFSTSGTPHDHSDNYMVGSHAAEILRIPESELPEFAKQHGIETRKAGMLHLYRRGDVMKAVETSKGTGASDPDSPTSGVSGYTSREVASRLGIKTPDWVPKIMSRYGITPVRDGVRNMYPKEPTDNAIAQYLEGNKGRRGAGDSPPPEDGNTYTRAEVFEQLGLSPKSEATLGRILREHNIKPVSRGKYSRAEVDTAATAYLAERGKRGERKGKAAGAGKPNEPEEFNPANYYTTNDVMGLFGFSTTSREHLNKVLGKYEIKPTRRGKLNYYVKEAIDVAAEKYKAGDRGKAPTAHKRTPAPKKAGPNRKAGPTGKHVQKREVSREAPAEPPYVLKDISYDAESNAIVIYGTRGKVYLTAATDDVAAALEQFEMRLKAADPDSYRDMILDAVRQRPEIAISYLRDVLGIGGGKKK